MLFNVFRDVGSFRYMQHLANFQVLIPLQPRIFAVINASQRVYNNLQRLGFLTNANQLSGLNSIRRNIDYFTVNSNMLVAYQLTGSSTRRSNTQTINDIVQTAFEQLKQYLTGNTLSSSGLLKQITELFFQNSISIFGFLLLTELDSIFRSFSFS